MGQAVVTIRKGNSLGRWLPFLVILLALAALACGGEAVAPVASVPDQSPVPTTVAPPPTETPIALSGEAIIYVVGPLSGEDAQKGQAQVAGALLAAEELNQTGGVLKRRIVIKELNDRGNEADALTVAQRVAEGARAGEEVIGVVMHEASDPMLRSALQVYLNSPPDLDPLVVVPASTEPLFMAVEDPRFFRISALGLSQARQVAINFEEQNLSEVVVIHSDDPYGQSLADEFNAAVANLKVATAKTFALTPGARSYAETVAQVKEINPGGVFVAASDEETTLLLTDLLGFEFQGIVVGSDRAISYNLIDQLGCESEGLHFASVLPDPEYVMTSDQLARYAFHEEREPDLFSVAGFVGIEFIARAYNQAGSLDAQAASQAASQMPISTLVGDIAFDGSERVIGSKIHFLQVQGRMIKESFDRQVGLGPQSKADSGDDNRPLLNLPFE